MNEDVRALKDDLENLFLQKSSSRRIPTSVLSKIQKIYGLNFSVHGVLDTINKLKNMICQPCKIGSHMVY